MNNKLTTDTDELNKKGANFFHKKQIPFMLKNKERGAASALKG